MPREHSGDESLPQDDGELSRLQRRVAELEEAQRKSEAARRRLERERAELGFENSVLRRELGLAPWADKRGGARLLTSLCAVLSEWRPCFRQGRVHARAEAMALGLTVNRHRNTVTGVLCALGREQLDWSAAYRLFSHRGYEPSGLFAPVLKRALWHDKRSAPFVAFAIDDSSVKKTGRKNSSVRVARDPLSPAWHTNLELRQRFVLVSALSRPEGVSGPCWGLPVGYVDAPSARRPGKRASAEEVARYEAERKACGLGRRAGELCERVLEQAEGVGGVSGKRVLWCVDGSLTNRGFLDHLPAGTGFIGRTRRDAALYAPANVEAPGSVDRASRRVYGERLPTPEAVLGDESIPWQTAEVYAARGVRRARYKEVGVVLWQRGTKRLPLRLLVVKAPGYRRTQSSRLEYRQPAYLLASDLSSPPAKLLQAYMDRWEIEPGFRDLKTEFGLGQAQVWSAASVGRVPSFVAATYGALKAACLDAFGAGRSEAYGVRPKWRNDVSLRPSLPDARELVRREAGLSGLNGWTSPAGASRGEASSCRRLAPGAAGGMAWSGPPPL